MERLQGSFLLLSVTPSSISQRPTDPLPPPARSPSAKGSRRSLNHWLPRPRRFFLRKPGARGANGSQEQRFLCKCPPQVSPGRTGYSRGKQTLPPLSLPLRCFFPSLVRGGLALAQSRGGHAEAAWSPSGNRSYCSHLFPTAAGLAEARRMQSQTWPSLQHCAAAALAASRRLGKGRLPLSLFKYRLGSGGFPGFPPRREKVTEGRRGEALTPPRDTPTADRVSGSAPGSPRLGIHGHLRSPPGDSRDPPGRVNGGRCGRGLGGKILSPA